MDTHEQIRGRILRAAARQWGHQESEMDLEAFDPLVRLLVEACSGEIARLERLMQETETRILERMLEQLSPEVLTGPRPAHGIAFMRALSGTETVTPELQCYANRMDQKKKVEIYFSPLVNSLVVNGSITMLELAGKQLHEVDEDFQRKLIARGNGLPGDGSSSVWLGLELDRKVEDLKGLRFYFNWLNAPRLEDNLEWLHRAEWSCGGRPLRVEHGLRLTATGEKQEVSSFLHREYSRYHRASTEILNRYRPHFVTLDGFDDGEGAGVLADLYAHYPPALERSYALEALAGLGKKLLWLRVDFPSQISGEDLLATTCAVNALPVANLRRHKAEGRLRDQVNIIPLETEDYYFDLLSARNREGFAYDEVPLTNIRNYQAGQFSIRRKDMGKFGQREAASALLNLLDVLRDESAAFSAYGKDLLRGKITALNQQLKDLEQLVYEQSGTTASLAFLVAKPLVRDRFLDVEYLSTLGEAGNGIIAGQEIDLVRFAGIDRRGMRMLTTTVGGRAPLSRQDRKYAYKKAIISRGRVVSREDIRAFCEAALGEELVGKIAIGKEFARGVGPVRGLERIMVIRVPLAEPTDETAALRQAGRLSELERELNFNSAGVLPLRVKRATDRPQTTHP